MDFVCGIRAEHHADARGQNTVDDVTRALGATGTRIGKDALVAVAAVVLVRRVAGDRNHTVLAVGDLVDRELAEFEPGPQDIGQTAVDFALVLVFLDRLLELGGRHQCVHHFGGGCQQIFVLRPVLSHQLGNAFLDGADFAFKEAQQMIEVGGDLADFVAAGVVDPAGEIACRRRRSNFAHGQGSRCHRPDDSAQPEQGGQRYQSHRQADQDNAGDRLAAYLGQRDVDGDGAECLAGFDLVTLQAVGCADIRSNVGHGAAEHQFVILLDDREAGPGRCDDFALLVRATLFHAEAGAELLYYGGAANDMQCRDTRRGTQPFEEFETLVDGAVDHRLGEADLDRLGDRQGMAFRHVERETAK